LVGPKGDNNLAYAFSHKKISPEGLIL
jgi:hypothetical protein